MIGMASLLTGKMDEMLPLGGSIEVDADELAASQRRPRLPFVVERTT
jgi:hypothetical protein